MTLQNHSRQTPIRILGIAPYEGMKIMMQKIASKRQDILLDVYIGDLQKGVEIVKQNLHGNYDVIISRGGTAELIEQITPIPVVDVKLSVYDILRALKLAENYTDRYAVVGFPNITENAHLLCDLLQYKIDIFTIQTENEVLDTLKKLKSKGYRMVLCDMISNITAKRLGLNAILITSGNESISNAFDQAAKLSLSFSAIRGENHFFRDLILGADHHTLVLKENGEVFFSSIEQENVPYILKILEKEISSIPKQGERKFFKNIDKTLYEFNSRSISFAEQTYTAFYFTATAVPFATSKYGIQYSNLQETEDRFFNSFYSITNSANDIQTMIEQLNQTSLPVMLIGEPGSGKEQVARMIYSTSKLSSNPLITIDCELINDRSWNFITNHYNSPFNDNNNTIYLKNISVLSDDHLHQLLSILLDMNVCKRDRLILSCNCWKNEGIPSSAIEYINLLSCVTMHLSPLREHTEEIPALASLYLNSLNMSLANQIIGLEAPALELLQKYDWPYNYTQFKRIINELALVTSTPYIRTIHVASLLEKEQLANDHVHSHYSVRPNTTSIDLTQPLSAITIDIVKKVLAESGGNQSAAAKQLGISRTTLWRYLK